MFVCMSTVCNKVPKHVFMVFLWFLFRISILKLLKEILTFKSKNIITQSFDMLSRQMRSQIKAVVLSFKTVLFSLSGGGRYGRG